VGEVFRTVINFEFLPLEGRAFDHSVPFNSGAFDYQILPSGGEFDQFFFRKVKCPGYCPGGGGGGGTLGIDSYITISPRPHSLLTTFLFTHSLHSSHSVDF